MSRQNEPSAPTEEWKIFKLLAKIFKGAFDSPYSGIRINVIASSFFSLELNTGQFLNNVLSENDTANLLCIPITSKFSQTERDFST